MVAKPEIVESLIVMTLALALGAVAAQRTKPAIRWSSIHTRRIRIPS